MGFGAWLIAAMSLLTADLAEDLPLIPLASSTALRAGHTPPAWSDEAIYESFDSAESGVFTDDEFHEEWRLKVLPDGLMYRSYVAGVKEPRFSSVYLYDPNHGWYWDSSLGGRVGVVRFGTRDAANPIGWQLDMEGAVFARLTPDERDDLESSDYRFGIPLTWSNGQTAWKIGYSHISAHLGDEFLLKNPGYPRNNYVRDSLLFGVSHDVTQEIRAYGEIGAAVISRGGGAKPLEVQFGTEYQKTPVAETKPAPFAAIHTHLRQEFGFGGNLNILAGWAWIGDESGRAFRFGMQYFTGKSSQYSFHRQNDRQLGAGLWFDY
jgi:hypothetical protein